MLGHAGMALPLWVCLHTPGSRTAELARLAESQDWPGMEQLEIIAAREKGTREDLSLTGNAVLVQLKKREPKWVMVQAFGHVGSMAHLAVC